MPGRHHGRETSSFRFMIGGWYSIQIGVGFFHRGPKRDCGGKPFRYHRTKIAVATKHSQGTGTYPPNVKGANIARPAHQRHALHNGVSLAMVLTNTFSKTNRPCKAAACYREQSIQVQNVTLRRGFLLKREHSTKIGTRPLRQINNVLVLGLCYRNSSTTDSHSSKDLI